MFFYFLQIFFKKNFIDKIYNYFQNEFFFTLKNSIHQILKKNFLNLLYLNLLGKLSDKIFIII
jgi:hypothetical protein